MRLIIGLGNPGKKYKNTRHNAGFSVLEYLRACWGFPAFRENASFRAEYSEGIIGNEKILLVRPLTLMNRSGESVQKILRFYKIEPNNIAIIHDDLDILQGKIRESFDSRSAGHRGVENIIENIETKAFLRIRIGIKRTGDETASIPQDTADFVLENFSDNERILLESLFPDIASRLQKWIKEPHTSHASEQIDEI